MENQSEENVIRSVLKNEITWLILISSSIFTLVYKVIIPINNTQLEVTQLSQQVASLQSYDSRITNNTDNIIVLQQQIKSVLK
jgi:hypothetical protein